MVVETAAMDVDKLETAVTVEFVVDSTSVMVETALKDDKCDG